ncbi:5-methylcytosine-specific restriction endonuclease system specificity protein McrC [Opitutales bacterium ASA1]|uniref:5-methylcytosine restriction system specificity protein McrC n=1 Tax=Congregicoccus parvus TaxID=3081749 RepID=UPI002B2D0861|nr:5-methylcytosine-specific restriction endonuclease system specificity protein McrC [Opitutales bacterium ASA1]
MTQSDTRVPIANLYHLLCYAWDALPERDLVEVGAEKPHDVLNLLGHVLVNSLRPIVRRGFERGYVLHEKELYGLRGRIDAARTYRRNVQWRGRAICSFDELSHDTLANRLIKAALSFLLRVEGTTEDLRSDIRNLRREFLAIGDADLEPQAFRRAVIHRNNRHYSFVLQVCALIAESLLPEERGEGRTFRDFSRDHQKMAALFEQFVFQFYERHASEVGRSGVCRPTIHWAWSCRDHESEAVLPGMRTDVCLVGGTRPMIIDREFWGDPLKHVHGVRRLPSTPLYQLYAYMRNQEDVVGWESCDGLLLFPATEADFDSCYAFQGRTIRAASVDLRENWEEIHARLVFLGSAPGHS